MTQSPAWIGRVALIRVGGQVAQMWSGCPFAGLPTGSVKQVAPF